MPALTNDPTASEVLDLRWGPTGRGPFLVRQEGYVPGTTQVSPHHFILQKNGSWLINLAFVMLPEAEQERQLFATLSDVMECFEDICAKPVSADDRVPPGYTAAEILGHFKTCTSRILLGMRTGMVMPARSLPGSSC